MIQQIWSESEIERLLELHKDGLGPTAAAKELGRTKDSVHHKLKWLKRQGMVEGIAKVPKTIKAVKQEEEREIKPLRKKESRYVSYPPLEWCGECHSPVSSWADHSRRIGCKRPA
jgi:hypothetical protein